MSLLVRTPQNPLFHLQITSHGLNENPDEPRFSNVGPLGT